MKTFKSLEPIEKRYTEEEVNAIVEKCQGVRTTMCKVIDCTQRQLHYYLEKHPEVKKSMLIARDKIIDMAEKVIRENLTQTEDPELRQRAAEFTLKSLGRLRGWNPCNAPVMEIDTKVQDGQTIVRAIFGIPDDAGANS